MIKQIVLGAAFALAAITIPLSAQASAELPGEGVTVQPARAQWNTGYFQEAIARRGLSDLGYNVKKPKTLPVPLFYKTLTLGDVDYWTNGWIPMHTPQMPENFDEKAEKVGYVMKAGGLQGYLISKKYADKFGITSLDDFKRDEVREAFDRNNDGKADLTACPPGWGCEIIIDHHMDVYGLSEYIEPSKASYAAGMAEAVAAFNNDEPIFFYTWAPNWTMFKFKPGKDVVWINVPETNPTEAQSSAVDRMVVADLEGAVTNPVKLGFVVTDIMTIANKKFLAKNPAARKFLTDFAVPLADINEQNTRMNDGEKSEKDIQNHVDQWVEKNQETWNKWLTEARQAAK